MQRVYRLETTSGVGVYTARESNSLIQLVVCKYFDSLRHPGPFTDKLLKSYFIEAVHSFGFISLEQLKDWFFDSTDRQLLASEGVICNEYEVEGKDFVAGEKQCIFIKENAKLLGRVDFI